MAQRKSRARDDAEQDWGLLYGYGLFETVRTYAGAPFLLDEHIDRMLASAGQLAFGITPGQQEIAARTSEFCRNLGDRVVRVTLTAGNPSLGLRPRLLMTDRALPYTEADCASGIAATIAATTRDERSILVRHKTLNQLQNLLAWREAGHNGYQESLFFNAAGHLAEGSRSNVFIVKGGDVITPADTCGILPGITRCLVIGLLREVGVRVREGTIARDELLACTECFLTNAVMEVMPVGRIGDRRLPHPVPGKVTRLGATAYRHAVRRATHAAAGPHMSSTRV